MINQQAATQTTASLAASLILLQQAETRATQVLKLAQGAHRRASKALCTAGNNHLLALLEVERLENLANADAYPEHRAHYLAEAAKRTKAAAILRS